jgi:ketosteroid isomerase-like protein
VTVDPGDNVEIVRRVVQAGRGYIRGEQATFEQAVRELVSEDVLVVPSSALASGTAGPFRGHEGVIRQQAAIASLWPNFDFFVDEFVELPPNTVVVAGKVVADRGNGVGYAAEIGMVWRIKDGLIVSVHSYETKRRALEEAGASGLPPRDRSE